MEKISENSEVVYIWTYCVYYRISQMFDVLDTKTYIKISLKIYKHFKTLGLF